MADNGKREYPVNRLEQDVRSKITRKLYCYIKNIRGITKYAKNQMNRRLRKKGKNLHKINMEIILQSNNNEKDNN